MSLLYFVGFWGLSYIIGIVNKEDWSMIIELINIGKMKDYIKKELFRK